MQGIFFRLNDATKSVARCYMAKKNSGKSYSGKSYTVSSQKKTAKNDKRENLKSTNAKAKQAIKERKPIALTDTSGVDGYFRPEVAVSRWKLGYEVFMSNFTKMIGLNLMMLVFLAPLLILLFLRTSTIYANASMSPFSANMGVGYLPFAAVLGLEESIVYYADYNFFMWMPVAALFLGIGLSGGMYVMRNLCWGESVSVLKTFFQGIKKNLLPMLASVAIYSVILAVSAIFISHINLQTAISGSTWYYVVIKILLYVVIVFASLYFLSMASMVVTYTGNFFTQLKNCFIFTVALLPLNAFFAVLAIIPFGILFFGSEALSLALILIMFLGASYTMLVWTTYSQWMYDKFVQGRVQTYNASQAEIAKHADREKVKAVAKEEEGYREVGKSRSIMDGVAPVTDYDVALSDLDDVFTRDDIDELNKSKTEL